MLAFPVLYIVGGTKGGRECCCGLRCLEKLSVVEYMDSKFVLTMRDSVLL
jgi:hypothetical protein